MSEELLIKISLVVSLIGIGLLVLFSDKFKIKEYPISSLTTEELEKQVKIIG